MLIRQGELLGTHISLFPLVTSFVMSEGGLAEALPTLVFDGPIFSKGSWVLPIGSSTQGNIALMGSSWIHHH